MDPDYVLFAKVVELGSLSAAGRVLRISPAMMSKRIARLEARLGAHLIRRTTRKLSLTPAGARLHQDISAILQHIQEAEDRVRSILRAPSGPLRVSAPTSFGRMHIAPHLTSFLERHPQIELEFDLSDAYVDLLSDQVDVAIRITSDVSASLEAHYLVANRRILCASPSYLARHAAPESLTELSKHRLIAARGQAPWKLINKNLRRSVDVKSCVQTNSSEIVRELVLAGGGIALRSLWDVADFLETGELVPVLPQWEAPSDLAVYAVHLRAPGVPASVHAFIAFLQSIFARTRAEQTPIQM